MTAPTSRLLRLVVRRLQRLLPERRGGLVVLLYHLVGAGTGSPVDLPAARFRRHLEEIRSAGAEPVTLSDGLARLADAGPRPLVALTFDDAFANFHDVAWPLLRAHEVPATLFVPVGFVDGDCPSPLAGAALPPASWQQLAGMIAAGGLEIGSHSWSHRDLRAVAATDLGRELEGSRRRLEERLATRVAGLAYPRALWSRRIVARAADSYDYAAAAGGWRVNASAVDRWRIARMPLRADMGDSILPLLTAAVWIEEWLADHLRRRRRPAQADSQATQEAHR